MSETTRASTGGDGRPRAVLLDRDGTIIEERGYLSEPGDVRLLPRVAGAIRKFREAGLRVLVLSNQSAVARGVVDRPGLDGIHARLEALLAAEGAAVDGIYVCPHMPGAGCACRKPRSGLVETAVRDFRFDPEQSFVVGDQDCDVELARNIGAISVLVLTGQGGRTLAAGAAAPDYTASDLAEAAEVILGRTGRRGSASVIDATGRTAAEAHLLRSAEVKRLVAAGALDAILAAAKILAGAFRDGGKVLLCGNGGSAADCQHLAAELVSRLSRGFDRPALPAVALTTDTSLLTAVANDCGFEGVFERQVQALGRPGDVLIAISTSGDSENVLRAARAAAGAGMRIVVLTGPGGALGSLPGVVAVRVPSERTAHVQEAHLAIEHVLADLVERSLFGREGEDDDH